MNGNEKIDGNNNLANAQNTQKARSASYANHNISLLNKKYPFRQTNGGNVRSQSLDQRNFVSALRTESSSQSSPTGPDSRRSPSGVSDGIEVRISANPQGGNANTQRLQQKEERENHSEFHTKRFEELANYEARKREAEETGFELIPTKEGKIPSDYYAKKFEEMAEAKAREREDQFVEQTIEELFKQKDNENVDDQETFEPTTNNENIGEQRSQVVGRFNITRIPRGASQKISEGPDQIPNNGNVGEQEMFEPISDNENVDEQGS